MNTYLATFVRELLFKFKDFLYSRSEVFDRVIKVVSSVNLLIYKVMKYRKILMKYHSENIKFYIFTPPECTNNYFGLPQTFPLTYCSALQKFKRP